MVGIVTSPFPFRCALKSFLKFYNPTTQRNPIVLIPQCIESTESSSYNQFTYADTFNLKGFYSVFFFFFFFMKKENSAILLRLELRGANIKSYWNIFCY